MMKKLLAANLYNPHEQNQEELIASFVARHDVFQTLFQEIKSSDMARPGPHYLIEGQRGMGKTTLLLRLRYEIEYDRDLRQWLIPVVLKEEAYYGIRRLCALWETLAQELEEKDKVFVGLANQMAEAYEQHAEYEPTCFDILIEALEYHKKKIILFIDNLGEMLLNFSEQENLRFRDILTQSSYIRLIGATPVIFEAILYENHLFADFFTTIRLEGLQREETRQLLEALGKVYKKERTIHSILKHYPGRIEALRLLTGGVIRTIVLLFEILTEHEAGSAITDLDDILDRVTPLYQSRMQDLTPLQRDVVNAIALNWDAISPEEIARKTRLSAHDVLTVLYELEKVLIVQQVADDPQQSLYQLSERFFNIWYLMRLAPGTNRSKVLWLLHFLESWYNKQELTQRARQHAEAVATGRYAAKDAYYLTEAFAKTGQLDIDTEYYMISETKRLLEELDADLARELSPADKEIFERARQFYQQGDYGQAVSHYVNLKHKNGSICLQIGDSFERLGDYQQAAEYFARAGKQGHTNALMRLGQLHQYRLHDYLKAETAYVKAVEQGNVEAMLALGNLYYTTLKEYEKAEKSYLHVIKEEHTRSTILTSSKFSLTALKNYLITAIKGTTEETEKYQLKDFDGTKEQYLHMLHKTKVEAAFQLGNLYANELENLDQAEKYYTMAVKSRHVNAMVNLGYLYHYSRKAPQKAITCYTLAIKHGEVQYAAANLGVLYQHELREYTNAERYYLMAVENGNTGAMNGLAWLYFEQMRHKERALEYALQAYKQGRNIYTAHTLACIYLWNNRTERAKQMAQEFLYNEDAYANLEQDILFFLMLLLAKGQYRFVDEYFAMPEMVFPERFKPLYYAYLHLTNHPDAQKLPLELTEPVQDLIKQIERLAKEYA